MGITGETGIVDDTSKSPPKLEISTSRQFSSWLAEQGLSLGLTTYQAGKIFLVGLKPDGALSLEERTLNRCMGMTVQDGSLWVSTLYQIWRYENVVPKGEVHGGYDRIYVPKTSFVTGDCDVHDMAVDADGRLIFVNTLFSCLATTSETHSFQPIWRPDFITELAAEDRCHMNGLAMVDGQPGYVTMVSRSNAADGWRDRRTNGGSVVSVPNGDIVATGLSMPHSPRYYDGKLWLLNSGTGFFGYIDLDTGKFEPVAFCAGYLRGLTFHGDFAIVGLSRPRGNRTFSGLALDDELEERDADPRCGLQVIDLRSGSVVHWLRIEGIIEELYDVVALPGAQRPTSIGFVTDEIRRVISIAPEGQPE
ncbi:MAG: TIGR03032 family protein [Alphaproteobacteria bacterium]|nr:TIGR03032 family protein [Alphaproteobacteria bacterium]